MIRNLFSIFQKSLQKSCYTALNPSLQLKNLFQFQSFTYLNLVPKNTFVSFAPRRSQKGRILHKWRSKFNNPRKKGKRRNSPFKLMNHNGLLKRIRIVGPRWDRKFKFNSPNQRHLLRKKSKFNRRRKNRVRFISKADVERVKKMIPHYKRQKFKFMH